MLSVSVGVFLLVFVFRVWRKHARPRLLEEKDTVNDSVLDIDAAGIEMDMTGTETQLPVPETRDSWKFLCQHTATEFAIVSTWSFVSLLRVVFYATTHDRISSWLAMSISYAVCFLEPLRFVPTGIGRCNGIPNNWVAGSAWTSEAWDCSCFILDVPQSCQFRGVIFSGGGNLSTFWWLLWERI